MKGSGKFTGTDSLNLTLTVSGTLAQWKLIEEALKPEAQYDTHPGWFCRVIRTLVAQAEQQINLPHEDSSGEY